MTDLVVLSAISEFIKENTRDLLLEKPPEKGQSGSPERVPPAVYEGYIPPKNYLDEYGYDVPVVLIGIDGGEDSGDDASLKIRITCGTYSSGAVNNQGEFRFDSKGYSELLYLMGKIKNLLFTANVIKKQTVVKKPLRWGLYEEQLWPYWHGWITFEARTEVISADPETIEMLILKEENRYASEIDLVIEDENQ